MSMREQVVEYVNRRQQRTTADDLMPSFKGFRRVQVSCALRAAVVLRQIERVDSGVYQPIYAEGSWPLSSVFDRALNN